MGASLSDTHIDYVDYTSLSFPSDAITVLAIRRAHPEKIDVEGADMYFGEPAGAHGVGSAVYLERLLARAAFEAVIGKKEDILAVNGLDRDACVDELNALYTRYGVSKGKHHTEELIRTFEKAAAAQAPDRPR